MSNPLVILTKNAAKKTAILTMNRMPVNSLSMEMFHEISGAIKEAESDKSIESLILTSSSEKVFSAGLDITEMHKPKTERLHAFWHSFQQTYIDLYGSRLACIAAIGGHAPAGGCILSLACDYRIMKNNEKLGIGLNETKLGISAPYWVADMYVKTIGHRAAEKHLALGTQFSPSEALKLGLIDEIADDVHARAEEVAAEWSKIPPGGRVPTKKTLRQADIDKLLKIRQLDTEETAKFIASEGVQKNLDFYLKMLSKSKL